MRLTIAAAAAATAFAFTAPSYAAEVYKDYVPSKDVYDVTFVHVNPNRFDEYLDGLKQTWWGSCQAQKKSARRSTAGSTRAARWRTATST